jgi:glycerol-3-phosphate acyltransferase PlsX
MTHSPSSSPAPVSPTLAVDVMGADRGPREILEGIRLALRHSSPQEIHIIAVGDESQIRPVLSQWSWRPWRNRVEVFPAKEVIAMDESPTRALRQKKDASMARAMDLVKEGKANGALSCGNTGALVALGTVKLRPMEHLERPALASIIPAIDRHFVLLDVGANPAPSSNQMVHNAILGAHYSRVALDNPHPRVGLLSIGTEEGKGNGLVQETHGKLKRLQGILDYRGLMEGFQLFQDGVDVVVCDGFVGNILLKSMESIAKVLKAFIRRELLKNPIRIFGCFFVGGAIGTIRRKLSAEKYGGAPLLGLNGAIFKGHGSSGRREICHAICIAQRYLQTGQRDELACHVARANEILTTDGPSTPGKDCIHG